MVLLGWCASGNNNDGPQIAALWGPIATFVCLGLEHSVANMFILPLGMALGADISALDMASNISVVALGNAAGAALLLGGMQKLSLFGPSAWNNNKGPTSSNKPYR
eukprot:7195983-Pyramimonas_sp.AAC.1